MLTLVEAGQANGYFDTLSRIDNDALLDKIVCLRGNRELASDLQSLPLRTLKVEHLFRERDEDDSIVFAPHQLKPPPSTDRIATPSMASHISSIRPPMSAPSLSLNGGGSGHAQTEERMERKKFKKIDPYLVSCETPRYFTTFLTCSSSASQQA